VVKLGALLAVLFLPTQFALDLQLLGGLWILQTFPALVFGLYFGWFRAPALLAGWAVGLFGGSALAWADGLKPLHALHLGPVKFTLYVGLLALVVNIVVAVVVNLALPARRSVPEAGRPIKAGAPT
jgi:solute:Na+ symporter, SSS family